MRTATVLLAVVVVLLPGCATALVQPHEASPVPLERQYVQNPSGDHLATVVFVRDKTVLPWGGYGYHQLFVDGRLVASLAGGESFTLRVEPGDHFLGILPTLSSSTTEEFAGGWRTYTLIQVMLSGTTYYFRVLIDANAASRLQRFIPDKVH